MTTTVIMPGYVRRAHPGPIAAAICHELEVPVSWESARGDLRINLGGVDTASARSAVERCPLARGNGYRIESDSSGTIRTKPTPAHQAENL